MGIFDFLFGSEKETTSVPGWVKEPIMDNVRRAERVAGMGYTPYYGPDVAAFTPMQNAAFDGTNMAAAAFGMPSATGNGMPPPKTFAGGIQGYSSAPMYREALRRLKEKNPRKYEALVAMNRPQTAQQSQPAQQAGEMMPKGYPAQVWNVLTQAQKTAVLKQYSGKDLVPVPQTYGGGGGQSGIYSGIGSTPYTSINTPLSYAPGGVNTANPASPVNQAIGGMTNGFGFSASRPAPNPWR